MYLHVQRVPTQLILSDVVPQRLQKLFKTELDAQLLGEILEAMENTWPATPSMARAAPAACSNTIASHGAGTQQEAADDSGDTQPVAAAKGMLQASEAAASPEQRAAIGQAETAAEGEFAVNTGGGGSGSAPDAWHEHAQQVLGMLQALTRAGRFALVSQLMGAKGHRAAHSIFARLSSPAAGSGGQQPDATRALAAAYGAD